MPDIRDKEQERREEVLGCKGPNPVACKKCFWAHGKSPFADAPDKAYCVMYSREEGSMKPASVYYDGGPCEYFSEDM